MLSLGTVKALDVIEHVRFGLVSRAVRLVRRPFGLERGKEALHRRIVPAPARLMLQVTPWLASSRWKGLLVYGLPRLE